MVVGVMQFRGLTESIRNHRGVRTMLRAAHDGSKFEIVPDKPEVGVYLYVYDDGRCVRDELQNDVQTCKDVAFEEYGVPRDAWKSDATGSAEMS